MDTRQLMQLRKSLPPFFEKGSVYAFYLESGEIYRMDGETIGTYPLRPGLCGYLWLIKQTNEYLVPYTPPQEQTPALVVYQGSPGNQIEHVFDLSTKRSLCGQYMLVRWNDKIPRTVNGEEQYNMGTHCKTCFRRAKLATNKPKTITNQIPRQ